MSKSKQRLFKHSFSKLEWETFGHNLSIGMQAINDQSFWDGRELIYRKREGVKDPQKRERGQHLKGKTHNDKVKSSKWESSTISTTTNIQLNVLEVSSIRSFSPILGKPARRGSTRVFISKPVLTALGQNCATYHQHRQAVQQNMLMLKFSFLFNLLRNGFKEVFH